ncbi:MAG: YihY/virulence factor BrkB family protein, partial [bacterium]|nr:YihY/virulence factor BrkB family protein [bacterium]
MWLRDLNLFKNLWTAIKEFFHEDGLDKSSILAYYSIFSLLFLLTFLIFLFTRYLGKGDPGTALKNLYPFTADFFSNISPDIFQKAAQISSKLKEIGVIGILFFVFLSFLIIKKIVQFINSMFHIDVNVKKGEKGFLVRRISEFSLLILIGALMLGSFLFTGIISTMTSMFNNSEFLGTYINSNFVSAVNDFLVAYALPFTITFLFFFALYKWIPEKVVYLKGAFISAIICTVLWELTKRGYAHYMINVSVLWKFKGPIIAVILFGFWMELSMGIMLFGAKLTHIFDREKREKREKNDKPERNSKKNQR